MPGLSYIQVNRGCKWTQMRNQVAYRRPPEQKFAVNSVNNRHLLCGVCSFILFKMKLRKDLLFIECKRLTVTPAFAV